MLRFLVIAAGIMALGLAGLILLVWWGQERMVFQPPAGRWADVPGARRLEFRGADGTPLFAYGIGALDSVRAGTPLVIHFHGNAEIAAWAVPWAQEVARRTGAAVLVAEYRGYSGIPGSPTYTASRDDAAALWEHARADLGAVPERTSFHGFSLGTAVATELAAIATPRSLVLEAPFTSAREMAGRMGPFLVGPLWGLIARVHYDTRARVAVLDAPVWVAHGDRDGVIPFTMGEQVFAAARRKGAFLRVPGAGHNELQDGRGYWEWLEGALGR